MSPIQTLIDGIKTSPSSSPAALPLRGAKNEGLPEWADHPSSRDSNRSHDSTLRKLFLGRELLLDGKILKGLYFFLRFHSAPVKYYYIGKANDLGRRIEREHLKNKDFIFYSIAFPQNRNLYLNEVLCFYGGKPKYVHLKEEYKRESDCLEEVLFDSIAWVGCNDLEMSTWEAVETHFICNKSYKPCCNVSKKNAIPSDHFLPEFNAVQSVLMEQLKCDKKTNGT